MLKKLTRFCYKIPTINPLLITSISLPPPPPCVWNLLWKVKLPLKICNCIWRLLHDSLPTFHTLKSRGIANVGLCPLCDSDEETATHLFLHFPFFRACWYGSQLAIQTSKVVAVCLCSSGSL